MRKSIITIFTNSAVAQSNSPRVQYTITTVAGNGQRGYDGDGSVINAQFNRPTGVAVDSAGKVYVADSENHRIRRISGQTISTVAGTGVPAAGNCTTGSPPVPFMGPGTSAILKEPQGMAVGSVGDLYIADTSNGCVRELMNDTTITTFAGIGSAGGGSSTGDSGPATKATLGLPYAIVRDSAGHVYIAAHANQGGYVREVVNGVIRTVAGGGQSSPQHVPAVDARLRTPVGLALDSAGNLYIADIDLQLVLKVSNGQIFPVAGGGTSGDDNIPAAAAKLVDPVGVVVDAAGNLYIADYSNRIRKVSSGIISTIAGNGDCGYSGDFGPAASAMLCDPKGLAIDSSGNIYVADAGNNRIRLLTPSAPPPSAAPEQPVKLLGDCSHKYGNSQGPTCSPSAGDPISIASGNMFYAATDYETVGPNKLSFSRYYNSRGSSNVFAAMLGVNWRSTFDRYLRIVSDTSVSAERADGQILSFTLIGGNWTSDSDIDLRLTSAGSIWSLTDTDDTVETYTAISATEAVITSIQARNGYTQMLQYDSNNRLLSVADSFGRALSFTYGGPLLQRVTTPDALVLTYSYSSTGATAGVPGQLTSVSYSTTPVTSQSYFYENPALPFALTGIIDEDGNRYATWTYDASARGLSSQHSGGTDIVKLAYNDTDGSRTVTNTMGQQEVYRFATVQGVPKVTQIDRLATTSTAAATRKITYDSNGYVVSETDWNGNLTTYVNDIHGRPTSVTEAAGTIQARTTVITYHDTLHLPAKIVEPGITTTFVYDESGNLLTRTQTDTTTTTAPYSTTGQTRTSTYTWSNGLLASVQTPRTDVTGLTQFTYDGSGALTSATNALGQVTQITGHLPGGLPQNVIDRNGVTTQLTYDARLRLLSRAITTGTGQLTTTYAYDSVGSLLSVTLPDGSSLANAYDAAHRLTGVTDLFQQSVAYTLDAAGDRTQTSVLDAKGTVQLKQSSNFDALGRVLQEIGGAGQTTGYAYDANGNVLSINDPLKRVTQRAFDALNRPNKITDPAKGVTTILYDTQDRPVRISDPNNSTTTYVYDGFGDVIQQVSPDSGTTVYRYDSDGNLAQKVDATTAVTNYTYDALDRVIAITYPANAAEKVAYNYDEAGHGFSVGRLTTVTDAAGKLSRSYDERGNLLSETRVNVAASLSTFYSYDAASRLTSITYPSGWAVAYGRDAMGQTTSVTARAPGPAISLPVASNVTYQPFGPVSALTFGNGAADTRQFDQDYRLTGVIATGVSTLQNLTYAYDVADNVVSIADGVTSANNQSFGYDILDRLTSATGGYGSFGYTYDSVGNRMTQRLGSAATTYAYAANTNRLLRIAAGSTVQMIGYTAAGNINAITPNTGAPTTLAYNQAGRLDSVTSGSQQVGKYTYDAFGQRLVKLGTATELRQYDQSGHLLEETDGQGNAHADYIYLGNRPIAVIAPDTGSLNFIHADRLGTPQIATDSSQAISWSATYQPFGGMATVPSLIVQDLRLPGQESDLETGFYHNGFRDYMPHLGRYLQSDPIGLVGGLNTYAYAGGNPVTFADPLGLNSFKLYGTFGGDLHVFGGGSAGVVSGVVIGTSKKGRFPIQFFSSVPLGIGIGQGGGVSAGVGAAISDDNLEDLGGHSVALVAGGGILGRVNYGVSAHEQFWEILAGPREGGSIEVVNAQTWITDFRLPPARSPMVFRLSAVQDNYLSLQPARRPRKVRRRRVLQECATPSVSPDTSWVLRTEEVYGKILTTSPAPE